MKAPSRGPGAGSSTRRRFDLSASPRYHEPDRRSGQTVTVRVSPERIRAPGDACINRLGEPGLSKRAGEPHELQFRRTPPAGPERADLKDRHVGSHRVCQRLCSPELLKDDVSDTLNYYVGATLSQAALFGLHIVPSVSCTASAFRIQGVPCGDANRLITSVQQGIGSANFQCRGPTSSNTADVAQPAFFCAVFNVCETEARERLERYTRSAVVGWAGDPERVEQPVQNPTSGIVTRLDLRHVHRPWADRIRTRASIARRSTQRGTVGIERRLCGAFAGRHRVRITARHFRKLGANVHSAAGAPLRWWAEQRARFPAERDGPGDLRPQSFRHDRRSGTRLIAVTGTPILTGWATAPSRQAATTSSSANSS